MVNRRGNRFRICWLLAVALTVATVQVAKNTASTAEAQATPGGSAPVAVPYTKRHIYSETADPDKEIARALKQAKQEHKRVLIDFGGDWCGDCQVLDIYFHQSPNEGLLAKNFVVAHVFVNSHIDDPRVIEIGKKYGVPLSKGVPALSVLDANGKIIHAPQTGEFENMRHMGADSVTEFLDRWKA
jgi:thiol:disulfide interchange protein